MGFGVIITVVDSMTKIMYFILTYITITIRSDMGLFLYHMWKLYSLLVCMFLDRDVVKHSA